MFRARGARVLVSCWSAKGGSGTTVVAAAMALLLGREQPSGSLLVDLAGDLPSALGVDETRGPGLADWLAAGRDAPADALARLEQPVTAETGLVRRGIGPLAEAGAADLAGRLAAEPRTVVVDCGVVTEHDPDPVVDALVGAADTSLLVLRSCFLAVRRAVRLPRRPDGVVFVVDEGRAITGDDVESVLQVPVVAQVRVCPAVARAVDAGLLSRSLPRSLERDLRYAA
jgi:MinD-like ATPase involved in chromosome partitioning or flagellar assembly